MNACTDEDDCPTPTRCRHLDRCPRGTSEGIAPEQGETKVVDAVASGSQLPDYTRGFEAGQVAGYARGHRAKVRRYHDALQKLTSAVLFCAGGGDEHQQSRALRIALDEARALLANVEISHAEK